MGGAATQSADINAALVAQAARGPGAPGAEAAPAITASPMQAGVAPHQSPLLAGVNPFRQGPSQAITMPGFQGVQNPFYAPPRVQSSQPSPTANLGEQAKAYAQGYQNRLSAAADQRRADALAAQQAYEKSRAESEWKSKYEASQKALKEAEALAQNYGDNGWISAYSAAKGGIASLVERN